MVSLKAGGLDDVQHSQNGDFYVDLTISSSFSPEDGLAFVVTGHGATPSDCKDAACLEVQRFY